MIDPLEISELLLRLVDRSLVAYDEATGRYRLLETVRQYAGEHALSSGDSEGARNKHFEFYTHFAGTSRRELRGPNQIEWLKLVDHDYDNIRLALEWGVSKDETLERTLYTAGRLIDYWAVRGMYGETEAWGNELEGRRSNWNAASRARLLLLGNATRYFLGKTDIAKSTEALRYARESGIEALIGHALNNVSLDSVALGLDDDAQKYGMEGIALHEKLGDWTSAAFIHIHLGNSAYARGDLLVAEGHYLACLRLRKNLEDLRGVGAALASLALVEDAKGDTDKAVRLVRQAWGALSQVGSNWDRAGALPLICIELTQKGHQREAAMMLGCSDGLLAKIKGARDVADRKVYALWSERLKRDLGEDAFEEASRIGRTMSVQSAIALAFPDGLEVPSFDEEEE